MRAWEGSEVNQQAPPFTRKVKRVWVTGPAREGVPISETVEAMGVEMGELLRFEEERRAFCISCNRIAPLVARCTVCGGLLCDGELCAGVLCANEKCRKAVCSSCRERVSREDEPVKYLCQPCYEDYVRERMILALLLIATLVVLGLVLFLWWQ